MSSVLALYLLFDIEERFLYENMIIVAQLIDAFKSKIDNNRIFFDIFIRIFI